nr:HAMP domain-containing sensor histidine kinase [Pedobacter panaciterrae]
MTISILGIVFTQGYWLYRDYKYYKGQPLFSSSYDFYMRALTTTVKPVITDKPGKAALSKAATLPARLHSQMPVLIAYPAVGKSMRLETAMPLAMPLSPVIYKTIAYETPISYILNKMKFQFGYSIVLILVTSSCFIYMLITIIMQRKLSLAKNEFINNMTHELKTPLATVSVAIEAIKTYGVLEDKNKTHHYLDVSKKELEHLSKMIEMIMQLSIHEKYQMELSKKVVAVDILIERILEKSSLSNSSLIITTKFIDEIPELFLDPVHFSNAIQNLIDNSIKYCNPQVHINVVSKVANGFWILSITDDGPGIPKKYQKEIFHRFFRVPDSKKHTIQGFGLGLFYVKQVAELHGGNVSVVSEEGKGSTFNISFPLTNIRHEKNIVL